MLLSLCIFCTAFFAQRYEIQYLDNKKTMIPESATKLLIFVFFTSCYFTASAQHISYGVNVGYSHIKYSFPVENDRYHTSDIEPFNSLKAGGSVYYSVTKSFRIGTALQYMAIKGKNNGGTMKGSAVFPNSSGELEFTVDNAFLILPVEFQLLPSTKGSIRPVFTAALNFFKPLKQNMLIHIIPDEPDPYYDEVRTEVDDNTKSSYFGARLGGGAVYPAGEKHEVSLMVFRNFNKSRYEMSDPMKGSFEKHEINFNGWDVTFAWILR
jgi:hypothetical protein